MEYKKILSGLVVLVVIAGVIIFFQSRKTKAPTNDQYSQTPSPAPTPEPTAPTPTPTPTSGNNPVAVFDTNQGTFEVTLDAQAAPKTVANFIKLANDKYCDGTKFHRIIKDFVIQGCDPNSRGTDTTKYGQGGPGYTVPAEIGLKANIGEIGMASTQAKGPSSGSQFFIVTVEDEGVHESLDGNYTFFGHVTSGMNIVSKIAAVSVQPNLYGEPSLPVNPVIINKITIK